MIERPKWIHGSAETILDVYNFVLAAFLVLSPWLFAFRGAMRIDAWASGALVAAISIAALVAFADWEEWLNLLIGSWIISSPWLLGFAHTTAMYICVGIGAAITYLAALELWLMHYGSSPDVSRQ